MKPRAQVEYRAIAELKELPGNPRTIKKDQFEKLKQSIKDNADYFEARPIILSDRTGELVILAGNQRQGQGNREEIQPATTPRQLQRNHALDRIRKATAAVAVSYSDIVYLQEHAEEIKQLGDPVLAEWAGIPEDEFMEAQR